MKNAVIYLIFFLTTGLTGFSQETGFITGTLLDFSTNEPLFGVKLTASGQVTRTNEDGFYELLLPAGAHEIGFSRYGLYALQIPGVVIIPGDTTILDTTMRPYPVPVSNIKATNVDGSWIDVTWGTSGPNIQEFNHDDGEAADMFVFADSGSQLAVKYDYYGPQHIIGGRVFTGDSAFPGPFLGTDFLVKVYDDEGMNGLPGNTLDEDTVIADQYGWVGFDNLNAFAEADNFYLGTVQIHDAPNCAPVGSAQYPPGSHTIMKFGDFNWDPFPIGNAMIRPWIATPHSVLEPSSFRIARLVAFDPEGDPMSGSLYELATTQSGYYSDNLMGQPGYCAYAVRILYNDGTSSPYTASNVVYYLSIYDVAVRVYLSDSPFALGQPVKLEGINLHHNTYSEVTGYGSWVYFDAMHGTYRLKSYRPGYEHLLVDSIKIQNDTTFDITFQESVYPIDNLRINPYTAELNWDDPYIEQYSWQCDRPDSCYALTTPEMDFSGEANWIMTAEYDYQQESTRAQVEYSTDQGRSWATLYQFEPQPGWDTIDIDLAALTGESEVIFRLHALSVVPQYLKLNRVSIWTHDFKAHPGEYLVTLNGLQDGIADTNSYQCLSLVNGQTYRAGINAIYSTGQADTVFTEFTYHPLFPPENLAAIEYLDTISLSWSPPSGSWDSGKSTDDYPDAMTGYIIKYEANNTYLEFPVDDPLDTTYNFVKPNCDTAYLTVTAVYDLSDYGYPGENFESFPAGPLVFNSSGPIEDEFFEDWSTMSFYRNCWNVGGNGISIIAGEGNPGPALVYENPPSHYQVFLTSFPISITQGNDAKLFIEFDLNLFCSGQIGYEIMEFHVNQDGSDYWEMVQGFSNSQGNIDWQHFTVDLSGFIETDLFQFRLKFEGIGAEPVQWKIDNIRVHQVCPGPLTVNAQPVSKTDILLNWDKPLENDNSRDLVIYRIYREYNDSGFLLFSETADTFYIDQLNTSGKYCYSVTAVYDDQGVSCESPESDTSCVISTLGIRDDFTNGGIFCYPNPAKESITIQSESELEKISLYNSTGLLIRKTENAGKSYKMEMKGLPQGIYLIHMETAQGSFFAKFIH
jgi:hypothetical protein